MARQFALQNAVFIDCSARRGLEIGTGVDAYERKHVFYRAGAKVRQDQIIALF